MPFPAAMVIQWILLSYPQPTSRIDKAKLKLRMAISLQGLVLREAILCPQVRRY